MRQIILTVACLVMLVGCDEPTKQRGSSGGSGSASGGGNGSFEQVTEAFAKALDSADYKAAYELTSSHLRGKMTADEFAKFHADARAKYGKPLRHQVSVGNDDMDEIRGEDFDDTGIPAKERMAWMHIMWVLEEDGDKNVDRCYETWLMMVKENGENKVGSNEYTWCD